MNTKHFISSNGKFHTGLDLLETGKTPSMASSISIYDHFAFLVTDSPDLRCEIEVKNSLSLTVNRNSEKL